MGSLSVGKGLQGMASQVASNAQQNGLRCALAIHRWFADGEGWAWSPRHLGEVPDEPLGPVLRDRPVPPGGRTGLLGYRGLWLVYHHLADDEPEDPKAVGRHPSVLRVVALPARPRSEFQQELIERLRQVPLPKQRGENPDLVLSVPPGWLEATPGIAAGQATAPAEVAGRPRPEPRRVLGRRIVVMAMVLAAAAGLAGVVLWYGSATTGGISGKDVREKLLEPLGVKLPKDTPDDTIWEQFRQLYSKQGMIEHFFPGLRGDVKKDLVALSEDAERQRQENHPDARFAADRANQLQQIRPAIERLPDHPVNRNRRKVLFINFKEPLGATVNFVATHVKKSVEKQHRNSVAKHVKTPKMPTVAGGAALDILDQYVVQPLKPLTDRQTRGQYERWFVKEFCWEAGTPFPWDASAPNGARTVAPEFCQSQSRYSDQKDAAELMFKWLEAARVKGIQDSDVNDRPWFVGRCFVEFLSLKHPGLEKGKREELERENSLVWKHLKCLPDDAWDGQRADPHDPWQGVKDGLAELGKRLRVTTHGARAQVQRIVNAIADWPRDLERLQESERERQEQENKRRDEQRKKLDTLLTNGIQNIHNSLKEMERLSSMDKEGKKISIDDQEKWIGEFKKSTNELNGNIDGLDKSIGDLKKEAKGDPQWSLLLETMQGKLKKMRGDFEGILEDPNWKDRCQKSVAIWKKQLNDLKPRKDKLLSLDTNQAAEGRPRESKVVPEANELWKRLVEASENWRNPEKKPDNRTGKP